MNKRRNLLLYVLGITITGTIFFIPFLGAVHLFDWDEINFAESAREMIVTGNYGRVQINFQPFWEKPPLFFWLQACSMHIFGINEFAARLPDAITGILTLLTFFFIGRKLNGERFGLWWALCMLGSFLPHLYFKSGIIDPVFNYFIFLGVYFVILLVSNENRKAIRYAALSGIFIGLATLTKGPVALLIWMLVMAVYWLSVRFKKIISFRQLAVFAFSFLLVAGIWFAVDVEENGFGFLKQFILYQWQLLTEPVAGHQEPIYYHFVIVFFGCFPMSIVALPVLIKGYRESSVFDFKKWMLILFWVVMILFTIVQTKIVHYSSLSYFPLSFLAAFAVNQQRIFSDQKQRWVRWLLLVIGLLISLILFAVPWLAEHSNILKPYIKDPFALACLRTPVAWSGWEGSIGIGYFAAILLSVYFMLNKGRKSGVVFLFSATAVCIFFYLEAVVPKIEQYSQGPAIAFYERLQGKQVYVNPLGFNSYAQYFYFRKQPGDDTLSNRPDWLLTGPIDHPAYFVLKQTDTLRMKPYNDIRFLYSKGGFAFYERDAKKE